MLISDHKKTVSEWLIWRREAAPTYRLFLNRLINAIVSERKGHTDQVGYSGKYIVVPDLVVNIDEKDLNSEAEGLEETIGTLDGKLSLLNATTVIIV